MDNEDKFNCFQVCVADPQRVRWVENGNGSTPPNAIPGGRTSSGETLYIGRAKHQGSLTPGKVNTFLTNNNIMLETSVS